MDSQPQSNESPRRSKGSTLTYAVAIIVLLLIGAAVYVFMYSDTLPSAAGDRTVLASVNGADITQGDVEERLDQSRTGLEAQGINLEDPNVKEQLESQMLQDIINQKLVLEDASKRGLTVSDTEVEQELTQLKATLGDEKAFETFLEKNKFTEAVLKVRIREELLVQQYIAEIANNAPIEATPSEIETLYQQLKNENANLPTLNEVRSDIESQIKSQKLGATLRSVIEALRNAAQIEIKEQATSTQTTP